jgi:cytochrome c oxidase subunit II
MIQNYAYAVSILLMATMAVLFVWVAFSTGNIEQYAPIIQRGYKLRSWLFVALATLGVAVAVQTLAPSSLGFGQPQRVNVVGHQWYWELSTDQVVAGKPVDFYVTTEDVTHGFAIYDESLHLVAQIQAMPGYTNVLHAKFDRPGTYRVLCLEYCGLSHHNMMAEIKVVPPATEPSHG